MLIGRLNRGWCSLMMYSLPRRRLRRGGDFGLSPYASYRGARLVTVLVAHSGHRHLRDE